MRGTRIDAAGGIDAQPGCSGAVEREPCGHLVEPPLVGAEPLVDAPAGAGRRLDPLRALPVVNDALLALEDAGLGRFEARARGQQRRRTARAGNGRPQGKAVGLPCVGDPADVQVAIAAFEAVVLDRDDPHRDRILAASAIVVGDATDGLIDAAALVHVRERRRAARRRRRIDFAHHGTLRAGAVARIPGCGMRVAPSGVAEGGAQQQRRVRIRKLVAPRIDLRRDVEHGDGERVLRHAAVLVAHREDDGVRAVVAPGMRDRRRTEALGRCVRFRHDARLRRLVVAEDPGRLVRVGRLHVPEAAGERDDLAFLDGDVGAGVGGRRDVLHQDGGEVPGRRAAGLVHRQPVLGDVEPARGVDVGEVLHGTHAAAVSGLPLVRGVRVQAAGIQRRRRAGSRRQRAAGLGEGDRRRLAGTDHLDCPGDRQP